MQKQITAESRERMLQSSPSQIFAAIVATQPSLSTSSPDKEASYFPCAHPHLPLQNFERNSRSIQDQLAAAMGCLLGLHSLELSEGVVLVVLVKCCC